MKRQTEPVALSQCGILKYPIILSKHSRWDSKEMMKHYSSSHWMRLESRAKQKTAQIVLCAFDKEKLLTAFFLAEALGGGGGHYEVVERLEFSIALATYYHRKRRMSLNMKSTLQAKEGETRRLMSIYTFEKKANVKRWDVLSRDHFVANDPMFNFCNYTIHCCSYLNLAPAVRISIIQQASTARLIEPDKFSKTCTCTSFSARSRLQWTTHSAGDTGAEGKLCCECELSVIM